ncbi:MAG: nicotinate phosphoribosyltransferase [Chloroflexi bacterium]|nr:nicotinate phosphoribosyltransferase [Chloroflexota bacterium]
MLTDLYELTMAASYFAEGLVGQNDQATFSAFIRKYPANRGYFVSAGLDDALGYLEEFAFSEDDLAYLTTTGLFHEDFLAYLAGLRFTGDVRAVPEGRLFFANEPVLEVTAPLIEAQIVETCLLNILHLHTLIATKAARCVWAAGGRRLVDFALRRTHGADAGMAVARACYLVGFEATSNVLAGAVSGIPITGTMAHSYIQVFPHEIDAFRAFARRYPHRSVFLIDTYDTLEGARRAARVAHELRQAGHRLLAVRLDSGDMIDLSRQVRAILDAEGLMEVQILASGGFDEFAIADAVAAGAPIDAFGVGTRMGVSWDAPATDIAYKLVDYQGRAVVKLSPGKQTLPGPKQVWRIRVDGRLDHDVLGLRDEPSALRDGEPLLQPVMRRGQRLGPPTSLADARARFRAEFSELDARHRRLIDPAPYPVCKSAALEALAAQMDEAGALG